MSMCWRLTLGHLLEGCVMHPTPRGIDFSSDCRSDRSSGLVSEVVTNVLGELLEGLVCAVSRGESHISPPEGNRVNNFRFSRCMRIRKIESSKCIHTKAAFCDLCMTSSNCLDGTSKWAWWSYTHPTRKSHSSFPHRDFLSTGIQEAACCLPDSVCRYYSMSCIETFLA